MNSRNSFDEFLDQALQKRKQQGLLRQLVHHEQDRLVDFCSNDYLGFATNKHFYNSWGEDPLGATGSRLVSGNSLLAEETEAMLAHFHQAEAALIFNSGYMANIGVCSAIGDKNSAFIYDEQIHASLIDGMRLSLARRYKFRHNDLEELQKKLALATGRKYVLIESVYSMDGDLAPIEAIAEVCARHEAALIVDEAHATGIYGEEGRGLVCAHKLSASVWARIHTFGKALGLHGAVVVGSSVLRQYLINHARSFIYTTALPPYSYHHIRQAYQLLPQAAQNKLFGLMHYFKKQAAALAVPGLQFLINPSPIQGIIIPGNEHALRLAEELRQKGFFVKAILSPTVAAGTERLRICLHTFNTFEQIDQLLMNVKMLFS